MGINLCMFECSLPPRDPSRQGIVLGITFADHMTIWQAMLGIWEHIEVYHLNHHPRDCHNIWSHKFWKDNGPKFANHSNFWDNHSHNP